MLYNKNKQFTEGEYEVVNKNKYIGKRKPYYRSSWERRWMYQADMNKNVLKWCSECIAIPYFHSVDKKVHNYFPDFYFEVYNPTTRTVKKYVAEVKPKKELSPPKEPKRKTSKSAKRYLMEKITYIKNQEKWKAARQYCKKRNLEFKILTEDDM